MDNTAVAVVTGWQPRFSMSEILDEIFSWVRGHRGEIEVILK
jgi:hypothetical protein